MPPETYQPVTEAESRERVGGSRLPRRGRVSFSFQGRFSVCCHPPSSPFSSSFFFPSASRKGGEGKGQKEMNQNERKETGWRERKRKSQQKCNGERKGKNGGVREVNNVRRRERDPRECFFFFFPRGRRERGRIGRRKVELGCFSPIRSDPISSPFFFSSSMLAPLSLSLSSRRREERKRTRLIWPDVTQFSITLSNSSLSSSSFRQKL